MLVLNGKKIKSVILGIFAMFMVIAIALSSKGESEKYVDTVSLPVSGKTVVIDARTSENQMRELKLEMEQQKHKQI